MRYQVLAINDDQSICDCCGKKNLKKVVWLKDENGAITANGETCAQKLASNNLGKGLAKANKRYKALNRIPQSRIERYAEAYGITPNEMKKSFLMGELNL